MPRSDQPVVGLSQLRVSCDKRLKHPMWLRYLRTADVSWDLRGQNLDTPIRRHLHVSGKCYEESLWIETPSPTGKTLIFLYLITFNEVLGGNGNALLCKNEFVVLLRSRISKSSCSNTLNLFKLTWDKAFKEENVASFSPVQHPRFFILCLMLTQTVSAVAFKIQRSILHLYSDLNVECYISLFIFL